MSALLEPALAYPRLGWPVFPCRGKRPDGELAAEGLYNATCSAFTIRAWWNERPAANVATATGERSGLFVLDVDPDDGGHESLAALVAQRGPLPLTVQSRTGGGGDQYFFKYPKSGRVGNSAGKLGPGLDTRGQGGYVILPPSIHPETGQEYAWVKGRSPQEIEPAEAPSWLVELVVDAPKPAAAVPAHIHASNGYATVALRDELATLARTREGARNHQLNVSAFSLGQLVGAGALDHVEVGAALEHIALQIGLEPREVAATIRSGITAGMREPRQLPTGRGVLTVLKPMHAPGTNGVSADLVDVDDGDVEGDGQDTDLAAGEGRPEILATEADLPTVTAAAWDAIRAANAPARFFRHGGMPVRIEADDAGAPLIRELTPDRLRHALGRVASWYKLEQDKTTRSWAKAAVLPPVHVVKDVLATPDPPLPILTRIVQTPVFAPDGTLLTAPGYHPQSRTFYAPRPGFRLPEVPARPSAAEVERARALIVSELFGDFCFVDDADRAHAVALYLLPYARDLIDGATPGHMVEAPGPGTGKGLLCDVALYPSVGRELASVPQAKDDDEWRKRLTALLRTGPTAVLVDNLTRTLDSGALALALTQHTWGDRLLGTNDVVQIPIRCAWVFTGNNPLMSTEIARRLIRVRLDPMMDRPWQRPATEFRHPRLRAWVVEHRAQLVHAALVLVRAWIDAGRPLYTERVLGSFEQWSTVMGGILGVAGVDGFLGNLETFYEAADLEGAVWRQFVAAWWGKHHENEVGTSDLFPLALELDAFDVGQGKTERAQRTTFGKKLGGMRDRVVDKFRVTCVGTQRNAARWRLLPTTLMDGRV